MKLLFRQRFFSWFDSYDIYDEAGRTVYTVEGKLSWGHRLEIYGPAGDHLGTVKEEVLTFLPRFALYIGEEYLGCIRKEFTFFRPRFQLDCSGWQVEGNFLEWDYTVVDRAGGLVMQASKELFHWTDTYTLDIVRPEDALLCLMIVLAIDAAKCSAGN
ncbi:LURP-one-related family protein [Lawsonibacter celer]|uniref:LURP-one-related family protein n=1 Tax=Lawsonibacter celer TaxID=2986526 RepID=UPI0016476D08